MAITSYKSIGKGVFGLQGFVNENATDTNLGYILSGITLSYESDSATCLDGFGSTQGSTRFNSRATVSIEGYYTSSANIPKDGDVITFDADDNGITVPNLTLNSAGGNISHVQVTNVELVASNSDYVTVSIGAEYFPLLPYVTPTP